MNSAHSSIRIRRFAAVALLGVATATAIYLSGITRSDATDAPAVAPRELGRPADLPLPSTLSVPQYEEKLFAFLNTREYVKLGWAHDKGIRDTGSFIDGRYYGTHPAVRVYYSPGVMKWLIGGRVGEIPDGEIIIKEQYAAPAVRHQGKTEDQLWESLESWTVMVKDSAGSHDGWFWSNPAKGQCVVDNHQYPFDHPVSGFGQYCVRCHAATHSPGTQPASDANEFTFISLRNIAGFPGEPIVFRVDDSWRTEEKKESSPTSAHDSHPTCTRPKPPERPVRKPDASFLAYFDSLKPVELAKVQHLPPVTHDHVVTRRDKQQEFVTSNQCMSCHAGLVAPFGPSMFIPTAKSTDYGAPGWDVSPHGEWRWTPMGLAGRDPVFFAQLESEMRLLKEQFKEEPAKARQYAETLADTCLRCHGAMGKRQFDLDHSGTKKFSLDHVHTATGHADHKYGALARDGVSCTVCHRMQPRPQPPEDKRPYLQFFLESSITGNFHLGPKGELYGPFKDDEISPYVMEHATGVKPKHNAYLKSSQLCGTCHTVALPAVDMPLEAGHDQDEIGKTQNVALFQKFHHHVEQATYLEWLNSEYENEINTKNPKAKSCQECHMSAGLKDDRNGIDIAQIQTRIAAIQDTTYPDAENLAPHKELNVRLRESGYRRHNFTGLNVFLVEMFNQFDDVLGVRKTDFMTGSTKDLENAVQNFLRTARHETATVQVTAEREESNRLTARVLVQNKAGHRFPSGVGFRRAFLELAVVEPAVRGGPERVIWSSGRTNELGVLLGSDGQPLATELFARDRAGNQSYQPHHAVIASPEQVQVYETLLKDAKGNFTTSFVRGCEIVKDNRLLPRGWKKEGPGPVLTGRFLEATYPDPATGADPRYSDGSGTDEVTYKIDLPAGTDATRLRVRATLYYQAMPPYFLRNLFTTAPDGPATQRLHHLASHLNLKGTPIEDWKLKITSAESNVGP